MKATAQKKNGAGTEAFANVPTPLCRCCLRRGRLPKAAVGQARSSCYGCYITKRL